MRTIAAVLLLALFCAPGPLHAADPPPPPAENPSPAPDTLEFAPLSMDEDEDWDDDIPRKVKAGVEDARRSPFGEGLLVERERWSDRGTQNAAMKYEYNRVDRSWLALLYQIQSSNVMAPRMGAQIEYSFGRERVMYGFQLEQPLARPGRVALGASIVRRTDHYELQQTGNFENTLAMLLGRFDYRNYFERDGLGAYLSWYVPDFSTVSVHMRRDAYRSLTLDPAAGSWFSKSRELRPNPAVDDGETHSAVLRFERSTRPVRQARSGFSHWIEVERAGNGLGGDFAYTRLLGDVRGVLRLTPATTLILRAVAGHGAAGVLPIQRQFPIGGPDALRAHVFASIQGDQLALAQAEYMVALWRLRTRGLEGGLHALAFVDAGTAWSDPDHGWNVTERRFEVDGGFGIATGEDNLRLYVAKNLHDTDSDLVISLRLHRPF